MTAAEVTQALRGFEERLRGLGMPVVDRLRPGLTGEQVDRMSAEFGVRLSQDAAACGCGTTGSGATMRTTGECPA